MGKWSPPPSLTGNPSDGSEVFESRMREYPIPMDPDHFIETRVYQLHANDYRPLSVPQPAPADLLNCYLVNQGWSNRTGDYLIAWRQFANIPSNRIEPDTTAYEFIGFSDLDSGRARFEKTVNAEIHYHYFLPGVTPGVNKLDDVAVIPAQSYHVSTNENMKVGFIHDGIIAPTTPSRTTYEGWISAGTYIVAEDSSRGIYLGPIIERRTIYIKAQ